MKKILLKLINSLLRPVPARMKDSLVRTLIRSRVQSQTPDKALRFLFELDDVLYELQGIKAIEYGHGVHAKHRLIRYEDFFVARIRKNERVLDIGCGNGFLAHAVVSRTGASVLGIDLSTAKIEQASATYRLDNLEFRQGDAFSDLPDSPFDVVILSNVLEHLQGRPEFLRQIMDTIAPGRILLRVPVFERDWRVPLKKELGVEWRLDPTHEIEYTLEEFQQEIHAAGLAEASLEIRWGEIWAEAVRP